MHCIEPAVQRRRWTQEVQKSLVCSSYTRASGMKPILMSFSAHRAVNSWSSTSVRVAQPILRMTASDTIVPVPFRWQDMPIRVRLSL